MRYIICAVAGAALIAMGATASAQEPVHNVGGPHQIGKMCWSSTNSDLGYGYWRACAPAKAMKKKKK